MLRRSFRQGSKDNNSNTRFRSEINTLSGYYKGLSPEALHDEAIRELATSDYYGSSRRLMRAAVLASLAVYALVERDNNPELGEVISIGIHHNPEKDA